MKKYLIIIGLLSFFLFSYPAQAADNQVVIHLFGLATCPHCTAEKAYLTDLAVEYPQISLAYYELNSNPEYAKLLQQVADKLKVDVSGVPFTVIGREYFIGYYNAVTTGEALKQTALKYESGEYDDFITKLINPNSIQADEESAAVNSTDSLIINLPILGSANVKNISLPIFTVLIAAVDGFNPCAMWILLLLISMALGIQNRRRMWILGVVFITTSAAIYFLFLTAWLNIFLFLGYLKWIRTVVGLAALGIGVYFLWDFFVNKQGSCKVVAGEKKSKITQWITKSSQHDKFIFAVLGIMLLAVAVNLIELMCSAGLPAVYTQVLSLSSLSSLQYYLYLLLYIVIFMLDDLIVFIVAMTTLKLVGASGKYSHYAHLIGGLVILLVGILMIFKPTWLMFG
ncbi:MAG: hypothetical protein V1712_01415 [Patescibacteria group bacterium]